jgi:hypothetical protein
VPTLGDWRKEETITADEWCSIGRTSRFTVYRQLKARTIPGFQIGDAWRIPTRWARVQLGEIEDPAYTRALPEEPAEPVAQPVVRKRGRPRKAQAEQAADTGAQQLADGA